MLAAEALKMKPIELIVIDIEGCLADGDKLAPNDLLNLLKIQEYQIKALKELSLPPLVINSGRSVGFIECELRNIGFPNCEFWSVAENGAIIIDFRKNQYMINPAITATVSKKIKEISFVIIPEIIKKIGGQKELGKEICVSLNPSKGKTIETFFGEVKLELKKFESTIEITHSSSAVDITPKGVTKGSGLKIAAINSGIDLEKILCIGDSKGDFPAFEIAGFVACPGNASAECKSLIKKRNGYISPFDTTKGVMDIISHHTLKN